MIKIILLVLFIISTQSQAHATTYYVRNDGGDASECTGLVDAAYPGTGTDQDCAFEHPAYPLGAPSYSRIISGGDTVIIDGTDHIESGSNSGRAEYKIGYGMPNSYCSLSFPYSCALSAIPSGSSASTPTRILGKGYDSGCSSPPQFYGVEAVYSVLDVTGDNIEVQCLEITDHEDCGFRYGADLCPENWGSASSSGDYGKDGMHGIDSDNVLIKNVNIHGMALRGFSGGRISDWEFRNVNIDGNMFAGYDGDIDGDDNNTGTIAFYDTTIRYNGCQEAYPTTATAAESTDYFDCCEQNQGCYGDGFGTGYITGPVTWIFDGVNISHNTQDGLDKLYDGGGEVHIRNSRFEGNAGNQIKLGTDSTIENSIIIGNCDYFTQEGIYWDSSWGGDCRAGGDSIALDFFTGTDITIKNTTFAGNSGNYLIYYVNNNYASYPCDGSESLTLENNIFGGGDHVSSGNKVSFMAGQNCASIVIDQDYNVYDSDELNGGTCPSITNKVCEDPEFTGPLSGDEFNVYLSATSPAIDFSDETISCESDCSLDYNFFDRGASWDVGALEYGSTPTARPEIEIPDEEIIYFNLRGFSSLNGLTIN